MWCLTSNFDGKDAFALYIIFLYKYSSPKENSEPKYLQPQWKFSSLCLLEIMRHKNDHFCDVAQIISVIKAYYFTLLSHTHFTICRLPGIDITISCKDAQVWEKTEPILYFCLNIFLFPANGGTHPWRQNLTSDVKIWRRASNLFQNDYSKSYLSNPDDFSARMVISHIPIHYKISIGFFISFKGVKPVLRAIIWKILCISYILRVGIQIFSSKYTWKPQWPMKSHTVAYQSPCAPKMTSVVKFNVQRRNLTS